MLKYYSGVGSRKTPQLILDIMTSIAGMLELEDWILRSGGAPGADTAFDKGVTQQHLKEIYIPWRRFNYRVRKHDIVGSDPAAFKIAQHIHPAWFKLSEGDQKLHARSVHQVLGRNLDTPSKFLVCWTPNGRSVGGTRTAIMLAKECEIPVYNLYNKTSPIECLNHILELTRERKK